MLIYWTALLHTKYEARAIALKSYTLTFENGLFDPIFFEFSRDILFFTQEGVSYSICYHLGEETKIIGGTSNIIVDVERMQPYLSWIDPQETVSAICDSRKRIDRGGFRIAMITKAGRWLLRSKEIIECKLNISSLRIC
jgi:hypothetical protein